MNDVQSSACAACQRRIPPARIGDCLVPFPTSQSRNPTSQPVSHENFLNLILFCFFLSILFAIWPAHCTTPQNCTFQIE